MTRPWHALARPQQLPPAHDDWFVYLLTAGRGFGMTRAGAEWIAEQAATKPGTTYAVIAPTWRAAQTMCIEGYSGVVKALLPGELKSYNVSDLTVELANGSRIHGYSADRPDRIKDGRFDGVWLDSLCAMAKATSLWDNAVKPAMTDDAKAFITTTPRNTELLHRLVFEGEFGPVIHVKGSTWDNRHNLSPATLAELRQRYEGTEFGKQELHGELLTG